MKTHLITNKLLPSILFTVMLFLSPQLSLSAFNDEITKNELLARNSKSTEDLDSMIKKRLIRILIPYSKTFFFFDGARPKELSYEGAIGVM